MAKPTASIGKNVTSAVENKVEVDRKGFIGWITVGWLAFAAATGGFFTMIIRFLFPNVLCSMNEMHLSNTFFLNANAHQ